MPSDYYAPEFVLIEEKDVKCSGGVALEERTPTLVMLGESIYGSDHNSQVPVSIEIVKYGTGQYEDDVMDQSLIDFDSLITKTVPQEEILDLKLSDLIVYSNEDSLANILLLRWMQDKCSLSLHLSEGSVIATLTIGNLYTSTRKIKASRMGVLVYK